MAAFTLDVFERALRESLPSSFNGKLCVAFSGGVDSSVLLHALAQLRGAHPEWSLRAVHIDHQLQPTSGEWASHCAAVAESLRVPFAVLKVKVDARSEGIEAAARRARYAALRTQLFPDETLITAHHADDQAETVLLALMRGSGVQGLAAMPALKRFEPGWHARPLLAFSRADLEEWTRHVGIAAIRDPSNEWLRHDRNYLRHQIIPNLKARWPAFERSVSRSARHLSEALEVTREVAETDLRAISIDRCLDVEGLLSLSGARRRNALRFWLLTRGLPLPSTRKLLGLEQDLRLARAEVAPTVRWNGVVVHWYRGLLYAERDIASVEASGFEASWRWSEELALPDSLGTLVCIPSKEPGLAAARLPERLAVRFRRGGEKIRISGRRHRHSLRNLFQENDVVPWHRDRIPLVFAGSNLIAVGDLAWSDEVAAAPGEVAVRIQWRDAPPWKAVEVAGDG